MKTYAFNLRSVIDQLIYIQGNSPSDAEKELRKALETKDDSNIIFTSDPLAESSWTIRRLPQADNDFND